MPNKLNIERVRVDNRIHGWLDLRRGRLKHLTSVDRTPQRFPPVNLTEGRNPLKHNSSTDTAEPYISQAEAGTYLGVTDRTIRSMISRGILPAYALGRTIRLKRSEIDAAMRQLGGDV
jgi:excisionase family DNA binding protein